MSQIDIFALGGVEENGKNLYCVNVDNDLFILDAGLKYPESELYGIEYITPDISYLVSNKDRIKGIFLTHGHDDHIGSVDIILKEMPYVKVYGSRFTLALLKDMINERKSLDLEKLNFEEITEKSVIEFDTCNIRFFVTAHSIPDTYGIILDTEDGNILYTGNYTFDQNQHQANFTSMYNSLVKSAKAKVLCLMTESLGALNEGNRGTILEFRQRIESYVSKSTGRIIFSLFSSNLQRLQMIIDISLQMDKKVAILGRKSQRIVNLGIEMGYLHIPKDKLLSLRFIDDKNKNDDPNLVVLITGERHEPYFMLQRMAKHQDRLIHLKEDDSVCILTTPYPGTEKMAAKTLDMLYRVTSKVTSINGNLIPESHASREEIKSMINLLHPKYILPVIGEFRHQHACIQIANCVGFDIKNNLIIPGPGEVLSFKDGIYQGISEDVAVGEHLIDGIASGNLNDVVKRDRELLAEDGVLMICANINPRSKQVVGEIEIQSLGFSAINEIPDIKENILKSFYLISEKQFKAKFINWLDYKTELRDSISRMIYKACKANPIIIPVLISTDPEVIKKELEESRALVIKNPETSLTIVKKNELIVTKDENKPKKQVKKVTSKKTATLSKTKKETDKTKTSVKPKKKVTEDKKNEKTKATKTKTTSKPKTKVLKKTVKKEEK